MAGQTELQKLKRQFLEYIEIEKGGCSRLLKITIAICLDSWYRQK